MNTAAMLADPSLLGGLERFRSLASWSAWLAFVKAVEGDALSPEELSTFREHTGLEHPRPGGYPLSVAVLGVQSGKSAVLGALVGAAALRGRPGETALLLAQDNRSAIRTVFGYAAEPFRLVPSFMAEVERITADTVELRNGSSVCAYPARPEGARGLRCSIVAIDEFAFLISTDGRPTDKELLRVAMGRTAMTGGRVVIASSPYWESGALHGLHREHYGKPGDTLVWRASAPAMNPLLPADYLARMAESDPVAYQSEVLGLFRAGVSQLHDPEMLTACVDVGRVSSPPVEGLPYRAHYDASGGRSDAAALCIGHREEQTIVADLVMRWPSPHDPVTVIRDVAALLRAYGLGTVQVDAYAGEFVPATFSRFGVTARVAEHSTAENHMSVVPAVNSGLLRLPDNAELLKELRGLERRKGTAGRDRADHRAGAHDDSAAALAGVVALLSYRTAPVVEFAADTQPTRDDTSTRPEFGYDVNATGDPEDEGEPYLGVWEASKRKAENVEGGMSTSVNRASRASSSWRRYGR